MRRFLHNDNGFIQHTEWIPYCWVNVECPDEEDIRFLLDDLDMPADFIESIADIDERPHVEIDGNWRLTILRIPLKTPGQSSPYSTVPIGIITNNEILITLCYNKTDLIPDFIDYSRRKGLSIKSQGDFVLRIIYSSLFWYLQYLKQINKAVSLASKQLERSIRNQDLLALQSYQKTLVYFNTSLKGNGTLIERLKHVYGDIYDKDLLEDVEIDLHQADITVNIYMDILESTLGSFASIISNNVNEIMKKMTGISIVLMIPTLVASFYGMNVRIPYENHDWIFWIIFGGSIAVSVCLYLILRKIHWL